MTQAETGNGEAQDERVGELLETAQLHHKGGDLERAEDLYREILGQDPANAAAHHGMGLIALQVGKAEIAEEFFKTALQLEDKALYHANLGTAFFSQERLEEAAEAYRKAIELEEAYGDAHLNLGLTLKALGRNGEACGALDRAVVHRPRDPRAFAKLAELLIDLDRHDDAKGIARAAANLEPTETDTRETLARVLRSLGLPREAQFQSKALVEEFPAESKYRLMLAGDFHAMGMAQMGEAEANRALNLDPENPRPYAVKAAALVVLGRWEEAEELTDKALELQPDNQNFVAQKGHILERMGRYEEAYRLIRPYILDKETYQPGLFNLFLTITRRYDAQNEVIGMVENALNNKGLPNNVRMDLNFHAGNLYADLGRYDEAFQAYRRGNDLKPRDHNKEAYEKVFKGIKQIFTRDFFERAPRARHGSRRPIFIVGMPRSGTSLTEQILAAHPDVFGAGELPEIERIVYELGQRAGGQPHPLFAPGIEASELEWGAQEYLSYIDALAPEEASRVTDKMPQNFVNLGMIALMFPEAKIIHTNRDPLDTCLSNYMQNFAAAGLTFAYDLDHLGHYYRLYQDLMQHWRENLPLEIYDLQYDDLVENPEEEIPKILEFVELPFDEACLEPHKVERHTKTASYDQVRQPIYQKSRKKWEKYAAHLGPLMDALGMERPPEAQEASEEEGQG